MKQLNFTILLTVLISMVGAEAFAYDFELPNDDGITIYYVFNSDKTTVSVSYRGGDYDIDKDVYVGNISIPESVTYNETSYIVTAISNGITIRHCFGKTSHAQNTFFSKLNSIFAA